MSNDTIDKIDEAIRKIKGEEEPVKEVVEEDNPTDTKIFNNDGSDNIDKTIEFDTKSISTIDDIKLDEEVIVTKKSNLKYYLLYFLLLGIVVILIVLFILFLYK